MAKNLAFCFLGDLAISVFGLDGPTEREFDDYMQAFLKQEITKMRSLTITAGGGPTAAQRKTLNEALKGRSLPAAVVSSAPMIRGVVTALSWFNPKIKAFPVDKLASALEYLEVPRVTWDGVHASVLKLEREIGTTTIAAGSLRQ